MKKVYSILCALLVGTASLFAEAPDGYVEMGTFSEGFTNFTSKNIKAYALGWGWQDGTPGKSYSTSSSYPINGNYVVYSSAYEVASQTTPTLLITPMLKGDISFKVSPKVAYSPAASNFTGNKSFVRLFAGHKDGTDLVWENVPFFEHYITEAPASDLAYAAYWITCNTSLEAYQFVGIQLSYIAFDELTATSYCMPENRVLTLTAIESDWTDSNPIFADSEGNGTWTGKITVKNEGNVDFAANEATLTVTSQSSSISTSVTKFTVPDALAKGVSKTYELSFPIHNVTASDGRTAIRLTSDFLAYGKTATDAGSYAQSSWFYLKAQDPMLIITNASSKNVTEYATSLGLVSAPASTTFTLKNNGGSPAVINSITSSALSNLSWSEEFPLTIARGETKTLTLTFGNTGGQAGELVFNYGNTYDAKTYSVTSKEVSVVVADPAIYLEQFTVSLSAGWINEEGSNWGIKNSSTNYYMQNERQEVPGKYLISPKLHFEESQTLVVSAQPCQSFTNSSNKIFVKVLTSADRSNWTVAGFIGNPAMDGAPTCAQQWTSSSYSGSFNSDYCKNYIFDMPEGDCYVAFESGYSIIDYVMGGALADVEDDLYLTFDGGEKGMVNYKYAITANLQNMLDKAYAAGDITIELLNGAEVVATAAPAIAASASVDNIALAFTPHAANETAELTIKVKKGAEVLTSATKTINIEVETLPASVSTDDPAKTNAASDIVPLNTNYKNSRSEFVYVADHIGLEAGTKITSLTFLYANTSGETSGDVTIWLENTEDAIVGTSFTDVNGMTQVFAKASYVFPQKGYTSDYADLIFTFDTPFEYDGTNLRVVICSEKQPNYKRSYYLCDNMTSGSLQKQNDTYSSYLTASPSLKNYLPIAKIGYAVEPPTISGKLTDNQGNALANQEIIARSGDIIYSANTDAEGNYSIEVMQADKIYNMNIMVLDAEYTAIENISLSAGSVADQDITHPADHIRANLTVGKVGTICLPYDAIATEGATFYKLIEKDAAGKNIIFESVDVLEAGHAYIYESEAEMIAIYKGNDYEATPIAENGLVGTYDGEYFTGAALADKYYFSQNKVWPAAGLNSLTVSANRAYIDWSAVPAHGEGPAQAPGSRRYVLGNGAPAVTTAVENINADENASKMMINGQIYILRGENMYDMTGRLVK